MPSHATHRDTGRLRADFDGIARLAEAAGTASSEVHGAYEAYLLSHLPRPCGAALEIGCGTGELARRLARLADRVEAVDLSPERVRVARARSAGIANLQFRVVDVTADPPPAGAYDCVVSVGTLHHLHPAGAVRAMRRALRPGGVLLLLDMLHRPGLRGLPRSVLAAMVGLLHRGAPERRALRAAYAAHGRAERYLTMPEVRALCAVELPGARVREHLLWRWSGVWRRPPEGSLSLLLGREADPAGAGPGPTTAPPLRCGRRAAPACGCRCP
ncbi:MAG TPA: class I SAM-dependent methyltransferase, partial [Longimicrobium sp.]